MLTKKRAIKIFCASFFIALFLLSTIPQSNNFSLTPLNEKGIINDEPSNIIENNNSLSSSNSNLKSNETITGTGNDQIVRTYLVNQSFSNNKLGNFNISVPDVNMNFSYGDFNFTFKNNYTTEHVIEDDNALLSLDDSDFILHEYNASTSWLKLYEGQDLSTATFSNISDDDSDTYWNFTSQNGALNFSISANFSNVISSGTVERIFNRTDVLGFLLSLQFNISLDANLTIKAWNISSSSWINITEPIPLNSSSPDTLQIDERFINERLNFVNSSDISQILFYFNRTDHGSIFNVSIIEFDFKSALAFDLHLTNETYVALEFDLRGEDTTINGFHAWIRTLNQTLASNVQLNISLYRANDSIVRTQSNLRENNLRPDYSEYLASISFDSFKGDEIHYFDLSSLNSKNLDIGNYFIVIKSNSSENAYSLITIPYPSNEFGDGNTEHQLKVTSDIGLTWSNALKTIQTTTGSYTSKQLDASSFKINVTRGFIPSDFNGLLRIENLTLINQDINSYPYNGSQDSVLEWGKGRWTNNLDTPIEADQFNNVFINLTGYKSLTNDLVFNVSYYAKIYRYESITPIFHVDYNGIPLWTLNGTLDPNNYNNWNFTEYWYIYPNIWQPRNLTTPNPVDGDILDSIGNPISLSENTLNDVLILTTTIVNVSNSIYNGSYILNLTSFNNINNMQSFLKYNQTLWETEGFMYGDNISLSLSIQDEFGLAPVSGTANATLFYPNNTRVPNANLYSLSGNVLLAESILKYDFSNKTIINITTSLPILGKYQLGFFWTNGTAIGCKKIDIHINNYEIELSGATYYPEIGDNVLEGRFNKKILNKYSILMASVNETTGTYYPNYYDISNMSINQLFTYELGTLDFDVSLNSFRQNESILNPDENVKFEISLQNRDEITDLNVKIKVQLLSLANEKWIIAEQLSDTVNLKYFGHPEDTNIFNMSLVIPHYDDQTKVWKGINAPIRIGGVKTRVLIYVEDENVGKYDSPIFTLLTTVNDGVFEGNIIATKTSFNITSNTITKAFERDECLYSPEESYFFINIFDDNYMSSLVSSNISNTFKSDSKFVNITYTPSNPVKGKTITLNSLLKTEFDEIMTGKRVSCEYFDGVTWINITSEKTDSNGEISFTIDTIPLSIQEDSKFRLNWQGDDQFVSKTQEVPVNITSQINQIELYFNVEENEVIYRNNNATLTFTISNTGNSTLKILISNILIDDDINYTIIDIDTSKLNRLESGDSTSITIEFAVPNADYDLLNFSVSIKGQNILSKETVRTNEKASINILDPPIPDFVIGVISLIAIAGIWLAAIWYSRKLIIKIETPEEEAPKRKIKKGRYVEVSEIKTEEAQKPESEEDIISEEEKSVEEEALKKEDTKEEKKKGKRIKLLKKKKKSEKKVISEKKEDKVKLDDLLKEEGLEK